MFEGLDVAQLQWLNTHDLMVSLQQEIDQAHQFGAATVGEIDGVGENHRLVVRLIGQSLNAGFDRETLEDLLHANNVGVGNQLLTV